jgi:flagellar hook protein FlgE
MMQSFLNGLSGLLTFSRGLKNVSNNVSNMNTPGFRGSDTFYRSVNGEGEQGLGTNVAGTSLRTGQGEFRQTGNSTDAAIDGAGFFVLRDDKGGQFYSRAGQFKLNDKSVLIDSVTGYHVQGILASGSLADINIESARTLPPTPTTKVDFAGNLVSTATTHSVTVNNVYDKTGAKVTLTVNFTNQAPATPNGWSLSVLDASGATIGSGSIRFSTDGSPMAGFNTLIISLASNGQTQDITFNFGDPGSFSKATQFLGATSTLGATVIDGSALAGLVSYSFDEQGVLRFEYSNGEKRDGPQLALADFSDETQLSHVAGSLYTPPDAMKPVLGHAGAGPFGKIVGGNIELSNIDLAQEFGDILIIQRGYQASSRVMTVANEMLEQLYGGGSRGG